MPFVYSMYIEPLQRLLKIGDGKQNTIIEIIKYSVTWCQVIYRSACEQIP